MNYRLQNQVNFRNIKRKVDKTKLIFLTKKGKQIETLAVDCAEKCLEKSSQEISEIDIILTKKILKQIIKNLS